LEDKADLRSVTKQISRAKVISAHGTTAYGEVKIWFHLFLNSALQKKIGKLRASGQSAPELAFGEEKNLLPFPGFETRPTLYSSH
jgi:hypothetical protein